MTSADAGERAGLRVAIFDNLAQSAYIQAKVLRRLDEQVDVVLDPLDRYAMSDPRWDELDIELPNADLADARLPAYDLPGWVLAAPRGRADAPHRRALDRLRDAPAVRSAAWEAARVAGWRGARMALDRAWVIRTLARYDCVIAYGFGPAWAALAGVPCVAETWGGDITMLPFYDTGDWEGHETVPLPGPRAELFAQAKLQRMGYAAASRIVLTDPRFLPFATRLGHEAKCVPLGFVIDTERYTPALEPELRSSLLQGREGVVVFMPSRQDWFWKGSDRLLEGFARAAEGRTDVVLACAGWGADLDRSTRLIAQLGIGEQVRLLPSAMSKARLLRYYRAADIVADQFAIGSYGGSALEAMSCARPLLIHLDPDRFAGRFASFPPVANVSAPEEIAAALRSLFDDRERRAELGGRARDWVVENHGPDVARRVFALCRQAVASRPARAASAG